MCLRFKSFLLGFIAMLCVLRVAHAEPAKHTGPLSVGEKLTYNIYWGFIPVGWSEVTSSWVEDEGRQLINVRFVTKSNKFVEKIYPVNDQVDSYIDPETLLPVRLVKKTSEGRHLCDDTLTFDREAGLARWDDRENDEFFEYPIKPETKDFYSLMFMMRFGDVKPGDEQVFSIAGDEKVHDIVVRVGKEELLSLPNLGKVQGVRLKVDQLTEGFFVRKIPGAVWVSREEPSYVMKMKVKVPVGSVRVVLAGKEMTQASPNDVSMITSQKSVEQ